MTTKDIVSEYKDKVKLSYKILAVSLNSRRVKITFMAYFINTCGLKISSQRMHLSDEISIDVDCNVFDKKLSAGNAMIKNRIQTVKFSMDDIKKKEIPVNNHLRIIAEIQGVEVPFYLGKPSKRKNFNLRYYYIPYKAILLEAYGIQFRRAAKGILVFVKRPIDPHEKTRKYQFMENSMVSFLFYHTGKLVRKLANNQVYLFYEKFSGKAEEGTYELFTKMRDKKMGKCYFIIDKTSKDYGIIRNECNVIAKYSVKYYWLSYRVNRYIATEAPSHLGVMRSNNKWLRRVYIDGEFFFLQHGVTYLKPHNRQSTFVKGREGAVDYIVVNSEKEKRAVKEMLNLEDMQVFNTGMVIFDKMEYGNITNDSRDIITIMLTWKPYEEHLTDFTKSSYYEETIKIYELLCKYIGQEHIVIAAHPKVEQSLKGTSLYDRLWKESVFDLIKVTKLLITDYSSVCYQCFYRGAGVLFYQYDLEKYEENCGELVPADDEYIGDRTFNIKQLESVIGNIILDGQVKLDIARTEEHVKRYQTINEWSDGNNMKRILIELNKIKNGGM